MKLLYLLLIVFVTSSVVAQDQGVIVYEDKMDLHKRLPEDRQEYKDMIPQFRSQNFELHYNTEASMYVTSKDQKEQDVSGAGQGHGRMRMRFGGGMENRQVYKNLEENKLVDSREFMTKMFLITGSLDEFEWKIADGQKQIMDYMCLKAVYQDTADTYTAWFTPQIQVSNGPAEYAGLPGMILQIVVNDEDRVITAVSVEEKEIDKSELKEPTKGKKVTDEEFREIVHEKMKEMRGSDGGPRMHVIRG